MLSRLFTDQSIAEAFSGKTNSGESTDSSNSCGLDLAQPDSSER
jgi:hypothetical protein